MYKLGSLEAAAKALRTPAGLLGRPGSFGGGIGGASASLRQRILGARYRQDTTSVAEKLRDRVSRLPGMLAPPESAISRLRPPAGVAMALKHF